MAHTETPMVESGHKTEGSVARKPPSGGRPSRSAGSAGGGSRGFLEHYKPEQGKWTRGGTAAGLALLAGWGAYFLNERLSVYEGDEAWRLLVTPGIAILAAAVIGCAIWWTTFTNRKCSDFMIATEGEMKKVNWSTRREIIGSTKVVILFTVFLAVFLFVADFLFQLLFSAVGVLKT